ncbi:SatD family protein [Winogradskyella aurantia]|uniref:Transcriptional regulator n=1 Tax=Winogradskyella aurantia TaxID=1915063 RepID=A0A265US30_9FLAO|nr:SatD family protein [Winogradskyella aurantia]OZV68123.1 transcriptional regulator [Winogradskyella aurantia]
MTSVITGDIIKSRAVKNQSIWLDELKYALKTLSLDASQYEIYRGDSFQLEYPQYPKSFEAAVYIKACIKTIKGLDVRLSIGIGNKTYSGNSVSESNGEAFQFSGETFETLKKEKQNLKIRTKSNQLNEELNLYFKLALIAMDRWTVNSAEIVKLSLEHPNVIQSELAKLVNISQDAVSKRQKRAHLDEILELDALFRTKISAFAKQTNAL